MFDMDLTFGELRSATCRFEAVLFTLFHSRVTSQEASGFQSCTVGRIYFQKSSCNTMTDCTCLSADTTAGNVCFDVDFVNRVGLNQGLTNDELQSIQSEVIIDITAVDHDLASAARDEVYTSN